jgi:D-alanyl-D-alanine carboxypeptidase/D-alanyl-D-alanine-endopeptidase (penicillin-binding protein 4)
MRRSGLLLLVLLTGAPDGLARRPGQRTGRLSRRALQRGLRNAYARPVARMGTFAVYIKVAGGRVLFARRGGSRLHPASCIKLVTAAAALRRLGKGYRFETVIRGRIRGARMTTPVYLWGQGDPSLTRDDLDRFAKQLWAKGVRKIPAGVVVDDSYFDARRWPPGFGKPSSSAYMTPVGAVSLDGNTVEVVVTPTQAGVRAKVQLLPASDYVHKRNSVKTGTRTRIHAYASRHNRQLRVLVSGTIKAGATPVRKWVRVLDPARYAGASFKRALETQGMGVGPVKRGRVSSEPVLHRHRSKPLSELVQHMNRTSNNFYAEQLIKALGAKVYGRPGTTRKGVKATRGLMRRSGISSRHYRMANGSGLLGRTRIAPKALVRLLERVRTLPWLYKALRDSLPVAGRSGTLARRFGGTVAAGRVRAKTGTVSKVSCLAGYVDRGSDKPPIIFAILHNGFTTTHAVARQVQDRMVVLLARYAMGR